ncbi:hypothetical protein BDN72DRAFT_848543 [Pluteus cervinus]|uniref:Uncharacterized protein n=1 Tax=Pluteus cervinus TaxID=181527 RepID=A0ACD3AAD4_9AGAR|nr:hypothetical protein BDN72DRAFT_848543 [Pluteus cervinus]
MAMYDWRNFTSGSSPPFGGLKEKILQAHRAGIKTAIAPAANCADIKENAPESVKTGIRFVYVENAKEALLRTRQRWSCQNSVLTGYSE